MNSSLSLFIYCPSLTFYTQFADSMFEFVAVNDLRDRSL